MIKTYLINDNEFELDRKHIDILESIYCHINSVNANGSIVSNK